MYHEISSNDKGMLQACRVKTRACLCHISTTVKSDVCVQTERDTRVVTIHAAAPENDGFIGYLPSSYAFCGPKERAVCVCVFVYYYRSWSMTNNRLGCVLWFLGKGYFP